MKRIIMMVLRNLFFVPYGWFMLNWYAGHVDDYPEESVMRCSRKSTARQIQAETLRSSPTE